jgi:hypothetical protein
MRRMKQILAWLGVLSAGLLLPSSCDETSECEQHDYARPGIVLIEPQDGVIIFSSLEPYPKVTLRLTAEAGLNTLSLDEGYDYMRGIKAFTGGETEKQFTFTLDYINATKVEFVLYDLCNQSARAEALVIHE